MDAAPENGATITRMRVMGVDPGVQFTGVALLDRGRWAASETFNGAPGCGKDWQLCASTARLIGARVAALAIEWDPSRIAIESFVDQGKVRRQYLWRHTTAACCQAIYDSLASAGMADLVTWQNSADVLADRQGYGTLHYLLQQGRAGRQVQAPGILNEHESSAVCHALWAEGAQHLAMAGAAR